MNVTGLLWVLGVVAYFLVGIGIFTLVDKHKPVGKGRGALRESLFAMWPLILPLIVCAAIWPVGNADQRDREG